MPLSPPRGPPNTPTRFVDARHGLPNEETGYWPPGGPASPNQVQIRPTPLSPILQHQEPQQSQQPQLVRGDALIRRRPPHYEQPPPSDLPEEMLIDLRALDYVSAVDENLLCPICRIALINPVTTICDHVFCKDCLDQSLQVSTTCPIDRHSLVAPQDIGSTHRLISNQLDGLEVRCPNSSEGCQQLLARSMVQTHVNKYCGHTLVNCPEKSCDGKVPRKEISSGCLHYTSICLDCAESVMQLDMPRHRSGECTERIVNCEKCGMEILRCQTDEHNKDCEETEAACMWAIYGCTHMSRRKNLPGHAPICDFRVMGPVVDSLKEEINTLRSEVRLLNEKDKSKDRRIKFLENERPMGPGPSNELGHPVRGVSGLPESTQPYLDWATVDSRDQYLLQLLESQDEKVDQISLGMTELEAKQTMMLFNETIPIKEQITELRSAQGVIGMHVRWLMNFRLQERAAAGPSNEPKSGGSGQDFQSMRRSSDTMRDPNTKL